MDDKNDKQLSGVKEIARLAGVSIATVDRVIHNRSGVSETTKEKINAIIKELNYQPNILASRLASKKVNHFAVLIPQSAETGFWEAPLSGIHRALDEIRQYGVELDIHFFDLNDKRSFQEEGKKILKKGIEGLIIAPSFIEESISLIKKCQQKHIPYVFINSDIPGQKNLCYIGPHLYKSGYQAAQLISYGVREGKILIVNISKEMDTYHHLLRKEEGFRAYFADNKRDNVLIKIDIRKTEEKSVGSELDGIFKKYTDIEAVFVTNSRVRTVGQYLKKRGKNIPLLVGYDFLNENIQFLKEGIIQFLICQKPEEQGYKAVMVLFQYLILSNAVEKVHFMPIDIITKENFEYYRN